MEAPEHRDRVRPLPPEGEIGETARAPSMRALLPMLTGGLVLVAFIAIISIGNTPTENTGDDVGAAADTTTTTPTFIRTPESRPTTTIAVPTTIVTREAPELGEVLPAFASGLNAIVQQEDGTVAVARWRVDRRFPQFTDLPSPFGLASFDATGALIGVLGYDRSDSDEGLLEVGPSVLGVRPVFFEAASFAWHADTPGLLALIGRQPTDPAPGLFLLQFDSAANLTSIKRIAEAGDSWYVAGFHRDQIAMSDSQTLRIVDTDGTEMASTNGFATATTDEIILGAEEVGGALGPTVWTWDLSQPEALPRYAAAVLDLSLGDLIGHPIHLVSPNGRHGAEIVRPDDEATTTIVVRSEDFAGPRATGIGAALDSVFFLTDDHIAGFASSLDTLFVIDWRIGVVVELDLEGVTVHDIAAPGYNLAAVSAETTATTTTTAAGTDG